MIVRSLFLAPFAALALTTGLALVAPSASAQPFTKHADLTFAVVPTEQGTESLELDLYIPNGVAAPIPLVVYVHGGGWKTGSKENPGTLFLVQAGFAVASVEYRLSGAAKWPAQIHDVKGAVRWLRANAATYGLDPERIGAFGGSAGGHLSAFLGTSGGVSVVELGGVTFDLEGATGGNLGFSSRVQAVADDFGPTDFLWMDAFPSFKLHEDPTSSESELLGAPVPDVPMAVASADPGTWLTRDDPPFHVQHGTSDPVVPFGQSDRFVREARFGVGIDVTFAPVIDGSHGGPGFDDAAVAAFFVDRLGAPNATSVSVEVLGAASEAGPSNGRFRISRSGSTAAPLTVEIRVAGTAREGVDFHPLGTVVAFAAGETSLDLTPAPIDDSRVEGLETIELSLCPASAYAISSGGAAAALDLLDDESAAGLPVVTLVAIDDTAVEGSSDGAAFVVGRTGPTAAPMTVRLDRAGRALEGSDYLSIGPTATIPSGSVSVTIPVVTIDDAESERLETVVLTLDAGPDYAIGAARSAWVRIEDDDVDALPQVCVTVESDGLAETDGSSNAFLLTRTGATTTPLTVGLAWEGEAAPGSDFASIGGTATFAAGERTRHVLVDPVADGQLEGDERLVLRVLPGVAYRVGAQPAVHLLLADADAGPPASGPVRLVTGALERGRAFAWTVIGTTPFAPYAVFLSASPGYVPTAGAPLLLDPAALFPLVVGVLGPDARATLAVPVPPWLPDGPPTPILLQAATTDPSGEVRLSERVDRLVRPARP